MSSGGSINGAGAAAASAVQALDWKNAVETFVISNIVLSGEQTLSGLLTDNSRVLVGGQTDKTENGIYISDPGPWSRAPDADTDAKVTNGLAALVADLGSTDSGNAYFLSTSDPIVLGVTDLVFTKFRFADHSVFLFFSDPGVGDDINNGFRIGDLAVRFNITPRIIFQCADNAVGAAVWIPTSTATMILETGGTNLILGAVADGEFLTRVGTTLVSTVPPDTIYVHPNHSGDVASVGDGVQTIAANAVTNAKAADMPASTMKGNNVFIAGDPLDLTPTQIRDLLGIEAGAAADQTDAEIKTAYENNVDTNEFSDAEQTKLSALNTTEGVQARRTTTFTLAVGFVDVTLDTTDVETDAAVLEHNNADTDRLEAKRTGLHQVTYSIRGMIGSSATLEARVRIDDTTVIPGSELEEGDNTHNQNHDFAMSQSFIVELTAGEDITLQIAETTGTGSTIQTGIIFSAIAL